MNTATSYAERAKRATTNQGLDPVVEALTGERLVEVEQTGGFVMVATVTYSDGTWAITKDDQWYAVWFPGTTWHDGPAEDGVEYGLEDFDAMIALVKEPHGAE